MSAPMLQVTDLQVEYKTPRRPPFHALKGVSIDIAPGETLGLVGESGSGKTTLGRAILGQAPIKSGSIIFDGKDITRYGRRERQPLARDLQVVFQDPYSSLNPTRTVGQTLAEPLMTSGLSPRDRRAAVADILERVGMPTDTASRYPYQFSGGQRQRISIARAIIGRPKLVVCDEPVSALDLSVQAQVLNLLQSLQRDLGLSMLFISHDLTVVQHVSQRTAVIYHGEIVETGDAATVHHDPQHPYTRMLLSAAPIPDPVRQRQRRAERHSISEVLTVP